MPNRTDHAPTQHPPGLPEPSYARIVVEGIACNIDLKGYGTYPLSDDTRRRAFNVAVAQHLYALPDPVANEVSEKVAAALPPLTYGVTHREYATQLHQLAEAV